MSDRYTRDKLKLLKKLSDKVGLECKMSTLRDYEQFVIDNANAKHGWRDRYHNMVLYTRWRINDPYTRDDIALHEYNTLIRTSDRHIRCDCKMCMDLYNPKGFLEFNDANYNAYIKIHGLFNDPPTIADRLEVMNKLSDNFDKIMGELNSINNTKKDTDIIPPSTVPFVAKENKKFRIPCCMQ
jgi:hypothetical protein